MTTNSQTINHVSLGDSIAAGHSIDDNWQYDYDTKSQYWYKISDGVYRTEPTVIVPNSYTDLIRKELIDTFGPSHVSSVSFAQSGDKVSDLMYKLSHDIVREAIEKADLVTICISANDILGYALPAIKPYIETGDLSGLEIEVEASLERLATDSNPNSYVSLFNKLKEINPNAKYIFTTIYNPYKYLWIEEGHNGFFKPILDMISEYVPVIDVDEYIESLFPDIGELSYPTIENWSVVWKSIEWELDIASWIKDRLLDMPVVKLLFDRVNRLANWTEKYVEGSDNFRGLNKILREKIASYNNSNFIIADTKPMFDLFGNRTDTKEDVDYSNLVNVEFTSTYTTGKMDWGGLWRHDYGSDNVGQYWIDLVWKYLNFDNAFPSTTMTDYVSFNMEGFADDLVKQTIEKVITPNVDPHPEYHGHQVLKRSFTNVIGYAKFDSEGGSYVLGDVVVNGDKLNPSTPTKRAHLFKEWISIKGDLDTMTEFTDNVTSFKLSDLVDGNTVKSKSARTTTFYASWEERFVGIYEDGTCSAREFIETGTGDVAVDEYGRFYSKEFTEF